MDNCINSKCICDIGLPWVKKKVIMIEPCEHLIHMSCLSKYIKKQKTDNHMCPFCNIEITKIIKSTDFRNDKKLYQKCIDIISMTNFDYMTKICPSEVMSNIPNLMGTIMKVPFIKGVHSAKKICEDIFSMNNIKINVTGLEKINKNEPKVFISNHTSHLDFLIIFYILETGFLTSSVIKNNVLTKQFLNIIPLLVVERGKGSVNTVDKMREYVEKKGSICLFPEGMITHPESLIKFRTGAFHIGHPVYPIILKYKNVVADMSIPNFILKIASHQHEIIEMQILDPFYPPFNETKIENVRYTMAKSGNLLLSRVSNKDIKDNK